MRLTATNLILSLPRNEANISAIAFQPLELPMLSAEKIRRRACGEQFRGVRYDLNMASFGMPGLSFMTRYVNGADIAVHGGGEYPARYMATHQD